MEWAFLILFVLGVLFVVPIVALVRTFRLRRESATREELANLTDRVYQVELRFGRLQATLEKVSEKVAPPQAIPTAPAAGTPVAAKPAVPAAPADRATGIPAPPKAAPPLAAPPKPPAPPSATAPPLTKPPGPPSAPPSAMPTRTVLAPPTHAPRDWGAIEERLGANWLNKIGTAALVIGVALLLKHYLPYFGPVGKIALGYALAAAMVALGVMGESRERYRIAARAVLGGGWAIAYFTTYAMHNVPAVRVVESAALGFALLFAVAAAMVAHSLRYNSQVATGFAYLLGFASVAVSRITVGTLAASALLAASLAVLLWRRRWYALEPLAIVASYALHWVWLRQVFEALGGKKPFPEFAASVALLTVYWIVWMASYFSRDLRDSTEDYAHVLLPASFFLNAGGYLAVMHYQSLYPHLRFWFLLGVGAIYLALSPLATRLARRQAFVLTTTIGAALLGAAVPYRYSGARLELLWFAEAEAFLVAGWRLAEAHLRKLGWLAAAALTIYVTYYDVAPRLDKWRPPDAQLGWMLLALAAAFYLNARAAPRLLGKQSDDADRAGAIASDVVATAFLLAAAWVALPYMWVGLAWVAVAVLLLETRHWEDLPVLRGCGHGAALLALLRLVYINMPHKPALPDSLRLITVGLAAAMYYVTSRRLEPPPSAPTASGRFAEAAVRYGGIPAAYSCAATLLMALLIWKEVANSAVGLAWGLLGLALMETGRAFFTHSSPAARAGARPLRAQGHALLILSFARIFIADLNASQRIGGVSARLLTVTLLAAIYYYAAFTAEGASAVRSDQATPRMRSAFFWFGAAALAALARFELTPIWVAVGWAALTVIAYLLGRNLGVNEMRYQALLLTLLVGVRCAFDNFYQKGPWHFTNARTATVTGAALLLYLLLGVALWEKRRLTKHAAAMAGDPMHAAPRFGRIRRAAHWLDASPHHLFFFVPTILLTILLSLEVRKGYLTAAWGLEGLLVFALTLPLGERAFRWFSLVLLLLCVGRIVAVDVWTLDPVGRIFSFLALGAALLLVSYLYARYREFLRRYL